MAMINLLLNQTCSVIIAQIVKKNLKLKNVFINEFNLKRDNFVYHNWED